MAVEADWDWDHVRVFLAVMRASSLREAGAKLGVSHPTIRRRLETFESELGLTLFDRRTDGLRPTEEARQLLERAESVESSLHALARRAQDAHPKLAGVVRLTAPELLLTDLLMPTLIDFSDRYPQIELAIDASYAFADLSKREADVAIRAVPHGDMPSSELTGRKAATLWRATYGRGDHWIGWSGKTEDRDWINKTSFPDLPVRGRFTTPALQRAACQAGAGLTRLPCFYADPYLERRTPPEKAYDLWVLVHPDLRRSPRLRVVRDELVEAFKRLRPQLEGRI